SAHVTYWFGDLFCCCLCRAGDGSLKRPAANSGREFECVMSVVAIYQIRHQLVEQQQDVMFLYLRGSDGVSTLSRHRREGVRCEMCHVPFADATHNFADDTCTIWCKACTVKHRRLLTKKMRKTVAARKITVKRFL